MPDNFGDYYESLINKYKKKGMILDSNLLICYLIGCCFGDYIQRFKVTKNYGLNGFLKINKIINLFDKILTSTHILTEVSNLSNKLESRFKQQFVETLFENLSSLKEIFEPAVEYMKDTSIRKYGIADSFIFSCAQKNRYLVLTGDLPLYNFIIHNKIEAINFNHLLLL